MEAIRFENITKKFGDVFANENVSLSINKGEIIAILGENGSGKTTLMNALAGIYTPDEGHIYINGEEAIIRSPKDAYSYKVGMVHQHFKLVEAFTAAENVLLGLEKEYRQDYRKITIERERKRLAELEANGAVLTKEELKESQKRINKIAKFSFKNAIGQIEAMCKKYGFILDPNKPVYEMSVSEKQNLEIIKVLFRGAQTLILDEPTAVLTPQEISHLFVVLQNMKKSGRTIIIITHKLNEVKAISDRVAIFRKGQCVDVVNTADCTESQLTELMVGHKISLNIDRPEPKNVADRLLINNLNYYNKDGVQVLKDISFTAKSGEILGIAGIANSGQRELLEAIAGLEKLESGNIVFHNPKKDQPVTFIHKSLKQVKELGVKGMFHYPDGRMVNMDILSNKEIKDLVNNKQILFNEDEVMNLKGKNPLEIRELGIRLSFVPEDRLGMGLVGDMDIIDNMMLRSYRKGKPGILDRKNPSKLADEIVDELSVSTPNTQTPVRRLSGGNIQKVLVGREISFAPKVLMAAYPVRGLDINSSYTIYNLLNKQKEKGTAVIFVGEDLDVLLALSDRLLVMSDGYVAGIVDPKTTTKEEVGLLMTKFNEEVETNEAEK